MRLRAADLRGRGLAALLLAVAAGIAGAQLPGGRKPWWVARRRHPASSDALSL